MKYKVPIYGSPMLIALGFLLAGCATVYEEPKVYTGEDFRHVRYIPGTDLPVYAKCWYVGGIASCDVH